MDTGVHFCKQCNNITFLQTEDNKLVHACKNCGETEEFAGERGCIYSLSFGKFDVSQIINQNKYITHDKTLPVIKGNANIKCCNEECSTNTSSVETSLKYIKYDEIDMKYVYICEICGQKWNN